MLKVQLAISEKHCWKWI